METEQTLSLNGAIRESESFIKTIHKQVAGYNLNALIGAQAIAEVLEKLAELNRSSKESS